MPNRRAFLKWCIGGILGGTGVAGGLTIYRRHTLLRIVKHPHPMLRTVSEPVRHIDDTLLTLSQRMISTLRYEALIAFFSRASLYKGLAAPQVGHPIRMIVCGLYGEIRVLINPEIAEEKGRYASKEFCLSLPKHDTRTINRPARITVSYTRPDGRKTMLTAQGSAAALLSHEIDHLDGALYIDYSS